MGGGGGGGSLATSPEAQVRGQEVGSNWAAPGAAQIGFGGTSAPAAEYIEGAGVQTGIPQGGFAGPGIAQYFAGGIPGGDGGGLSYEAGGHDAWLGEVADTAAVGTAGLEGQAAAHEYNRLASEDPAAANAYLQQISNPENLGGPPPSMSLFTGAPESNEGRTLDLNSDTYATEFRNDYDAAYADAFGHNTGLIPTMVNNSLAGKAYNWATGDNIMPVTEANPTGQTTGTPLYEQEGFDIDNIDNLPVPNTPCLLYTSPSPRDS